MRHAAPLSLLPLLLLAACTEAPSPAVAEAPGAAVAVDEVVFDQPVEEIPPATAPATAAAGPARFDGYAAMRFGMTVEEARTAMDGALGDLPDGGHGGADGDACHYLGPSWEGAPSDLAFMFDGGRFVRYDVGNDGETAPGGGRHGMREDAIRALYPGRVEASPHKYTDGQYLRIEDPEGDGVLVFETDADGTVTEWRAGVPPQVGYVEGCS